MSKKDEIETDERRRMNRGDNANEIIPRLWLGNSKSSIDELGSAIAFAIYSKPFW